MGSIASEELAQADPSPNPVGSSRPRPTASVVINNHNYAAFLMEAIESALGQTYAPLEVVVVDDGSTDGSREIIEAYGSKLVAVQLPYSRGQPAAINAGVEASCGEFVFLLDSDDVFVPMKLEQVVAEFQRHPAAGACFHGLEYLSSIGRHEAPLLEVSGLCDFRADFRAGRLPFISTTTSALCFRRAALESVLPLPELPQDALGDHFLKWSMLGTVPVLFDQRRLTLQRLHDRNLYTRSRHWREVSEKESVNALWLRRRLPSAARVSRRLMVQSVARRLRHGEAPRRSKSVAAYYAEAGRGESAAIVARAVALLAARGARALVSGRSDGAEAAIASPPR